MQRCRHKEFIRFLNAIEGEIPASKIIHGILDNYGSHKHPKKRRLKRGVFRSLVDLQGAT
jgi:hypothetical protein